MYILFALMNFFISVNLNLIFTIYLHSIHMVAELGQESPGEYTEMRTNNFIKLRGKSLKPKVTNPAAD